MPRITRDKPVNITQQLRVVAEKPYAANAACALFGKTGT